MKINQHLSNVVLRAAMTSIVLLAVLVALPALSWADGNQAQQQSATPIAPKPDYKISIYPQPDQRKRRIGYGKGGDTVTSLEQVGSNQGTT